MKITIITDGNNKLGMGHVYQSMTLADLLSEKINTTDEIYFLTKSDKDIIDLLKKTGYPVYQYPNDDLILEALKNKAPDRIIFDKLDVSPILASRIKEKLQGKLIIFTNLTEANKFADMTVLARIGTNYKNITKTENQLVQTEYVGPKYWMLRPEFYALREKIKINNDSVKNIMLIFGGSDPCNYSSLVLNELLQIDKEFKIQLVLGLSFEHHKILYTVLYKNKLSKSEVNIVKNITDVGKAMYKSDLVITSPGLSFFEALVVGTPVLVFHQNEGHVEEFAHIWPTMDITDLYKLSSIIKNKSFLFPNSPIISSMEIGDGKDEILAEILN